MRAPAGEVGGWRRDAEGYLYDPDEWSEDFAQMVAREEDLDLTAEHWEVVRFIRDWQAEHQVSPDARHVMKHLSAVYGAGRNRLFELFPYGYVRQGCKIAGMRKPRAWSTG